MSRRNKGTRYLTGRRGNGAQREKFALLCSRCLCLRLSCGKCPKCAEVQP